MIPLWLSIPCAIIAWGFIAITIIKAWVGLVPAFRTRRWHRRYRRGQA